MSALLNWACLNEPFIELSLCPAIESIAVCAVPASAEKTVQPPQAWPSLLWLSPSLPALPDPHPPAGGRARGGPAAARGGGAAGGPQAAGGPGGQAAACGRSAAQAAGAAAVTAARPGLAAPACAPSLWNLACASLRNVALPRLGLTAPCDPSILQRTQPASQAEQASVQGSAPCCAAPAALPPPPSSSPRQRPSHLSVRQVAHAGPALVPHGPARSQPAGHRLCGAPRAAAAGGGPRVVAGCRRGRGRRKGRGRGRGVGLANQLQAAQARVKPGRRLMRSSRSQSASRARSLPPCLTCVVG